LSIQNNVSELLGPLVSDLGYEFVGLEYHAHASNGLLRVYIDKPETGVLVDDCARASREISALLDVHDPIKGHFNLEVSSPGMNRPLFCAAQFERFIGSQVKLTAALPIDGQRKFKGTIKIVDGELITLTQDGQDVEIEHSNIVKARLVPQF
jgi:ribosome maturation factor RimP